MKLIDDLLEQHEKTHGNLCPDALLALRMAVLGFAQVGIEDPRGADRNKLVVGLEIDRWLAGGRSGGRDRRTIGQTNVEVSRLWEAGSHFLKQRDRQGRAYRGA
jgi:hypothetical protein